MPLKPFALVPGVLFWVSVLVTVATRSPVWAGISIGLALITVIGFLSHSATGPATLEKKVWDQGIPAAGTVVASRTNGVLNDHPYVELELEIGERRVQVRQVVSQLMLSRVQPGEIVDVRVDPADEDFVVLDERLTPYGY